jgi:hypothetical protein
LHGTCLEKKKVLYFDETKNTPYYWGYLELDWDFDIQLLAIMIAIENYLGYSRKQ